MYMDLPLASMSTSTPAETGLVGGPGIANVDTRAITMRLRDTGCLNGVICDDLSVPVDDLVARCKGWTIVGKDLIKEVRPRGLQHWSFCHAICGWQSSQPFLDRICLVVRGNGRCLQVYGLQRAACLHARHGVRRISAGGNMFL